MPSEPIKVVVTGAAGQIGYSLLYQIASGYVFGADQPLILSLLDITPMMGVLNGVVMELHDCAMPLIRDIIATDDPAVAFKVKNVILKSFSGISSCDTLGHRCRLLGGCHASQGGDGEEGLVGRKRQNFQSSGKILEA